MGSAWQEAVLKLNEVQHVEVYNAAIAACGKAHKWQVSLDLLHKLRQTHLKATIVSFNAAISACERVSLWNCFQLCKIRDCKKAWLHILLQSVRVEKVHSGKVPSICWRKLKETMQML